jgi:hypothetical protein
MAYRTPGFTPTPGTPSNVDSFETLVDGTSLLLASQPNSLAAAIVDLQKTLADGYAVTDLLASSVTFEDQQTIVFSASQNRMIPGSSGDSSLKFKEVVDPNVTIKAGYLLLSDGKELAVSADLSVNLTTAAGGGSPADGYYYLYIDLDALPAQTTVAGREIYELTQGQFAAKVATPDSINLARYIPLGVVNRSSGSWSSSNFASLAFRRHDKPTVAVSPVVYSLGSISATSHPFNTNIAHNTNVAPENQNWSCIINGTDGYITQSAPDSWLLDIVDSNNIKVDFSFLATGDVATIKLQDMGVTATVVPTKTYDSGAKTGTVLGGASVNISHGLGMVPTSVVLQREVTTGVWENLDPSNYIAVSASAITGDLSSMASDTLRIVCSAAPEAIATAGDVTIGGDMVVTGDLQVNGTITSGTSTLVLDGPNMTIQAGTSQGISIKTNAGATTAMSVTSAGIITFSNDVIIQGAMDWAYGLFYKSSSSVVAWSKTGTFSVSTGVSLKAEVGGKVFTIPASTAVTIVDSATTGRDYYIYLRTDGTLGAYLDSSSAPSGGRLVGGFHYAPGGNTSGEGKTTPQINQFSFWDLKWKPACSDPRGMTLVAGKFWADIYLLNQSAYAAAGVPSSKYNLNIADGASDSSSTPLIPADFGGNGTSRYVKANWWNMGECLGSFQKRHPTNQEFMMLAYGTTEESSVGSDPVTTGLSGGTYTSKWGVIQSTGCLWVWGQEWNSNGTTFTAGWTDLDTSLARGQVYQDTNAQVRTVIFGGSWGGTSYFGSRCSYWGTSPSDSGNSVSARGVCDHVILV